MGTRADFYVGRGEQAEWLGSIAWDGHPESIDAQVLGCSSPEAFRHALADFFSKRDDVTLPADGWPWPWDDSRTTDYAYAFDGDTVWAAIFGRGWWKASKELSEDEQEAISAQEKESNFPNMRARQNVTFGKRSGTIVVSF